MTLPCAQNLIFRFLQSRQKVQIWLYEQSDLRIEGRIIVSFCYSQHLLSHTCRQCFACTPACPADSQRSVLRQLCSFRTLPLTKCCGLIVQGFDEYMNLVLDEAEEVSMKRQTRKAIGKAGSLFRLHKSPAQRAC